MKNIFAIVVYLIFGSCCMALAQDTRTQADLNQANEQLKLQIETASKNNNFYFVENRGQWKSDVLFMANGKSGRTWITKSAMVFEQFEAPDTDARMTESIKETKAHAVAIEFVDAHPVDVSIGEASKVSYNFMIGNDESKHRSDVKLYPEVKIMNVYEGIDMRYYFENGEVRYDYIIAPYADPSQIEMEIKGSLSNRIENGELIMETSLNPVVQKDIFAHQNEVGSKSIKNSVDAKFQIKGNRLQFDVGDYDKSKGLIIDPLILINQHVIATANSSETVYDIKVAPNGGVYFCSHTNSSTFPVTFGSYNSGYDIIVGKFTYDLSVAWMTFLGGSSDDESRAIEVDENYIYVTGRTSSNNFPLRNQYYASLVGTHSNYFSVLDITGSTLMYSTYLGNQAGGPTDGSIKVLPNGKVFLTTSAKSGIYQLNQITSQSPTTDPAKVHGYIMGFTPSGTLNYTLAFASLFGGNDNTYIKSIDVDAQENIYITGNTQSGATGFYPTTGAYKTTNTTGNRAVYVTKLNLAQRLQINYNSFYANTGNYGEGALSIIFANEKMIFGGSVSGNQIPLVNAFDETYTGAFQFEKNAFLGVIRPNAGGTSDLIYSSYFSGGGHSTIQDIDYDYNCDHIVFTGSTFYELEGYTQYIPEEFQEIGLRRNIMVGTVDIERSGVHTLAEIAYIGAEGAGYAISMGSTVSTLYVGGAKYPGGDIAMYFLVKEDCKVDNDPPVDCPPNIDDWLQVRSVEGEGCEEGQCRIEHYFRIPPEYIGIFEFMEVIPSSDGYYAPSSIVFASGTDLTYLDGCIESGMTYTITLELQREYLDRDPCIISKTVYCSAVPPPDPPEETPPCFPDCDSIPFREWPDITFPLTYPAGCSVTVSYVSRFGCDGKQEIQITKMEKHGLPGIVCDPQSDQGLYLLALREIIAENKMNFEPRNPGDTASIWRVSQASCWAQYNITKIFEVPDDPENPGGGGGSTGGTTTYEKNIAVHIPCNTECCVKEILVTIVEGDPPTYVVVGFGDLYGDWECDEIYYDTPAGIPPAHLECTPTCDMLEDIVEVFNPKLSPNFSSNLPVKEHIINSSLEIDLGISITSQILEIQADNTDAANIGIYIHTVNGSQLFNLTDVLHSGTNNFEVNISDYLSGSYFYNIVIDGEPVKAGIFTVVK